MFTLKKPISSRLWRLVAVLGTAAFPVAMMLPGCNGGSSSSNVREVQQVNSFVPLSNNQAGTLDLHVYNNNKARGTFTITNAAAIAAITGTPRATTPFRLGVYNLSGLVDPATGHIELKGSIPGSGDFTISVSLPTATRTGELTAHIGGQDFGPITLPTTANPTSTPAGNATATPVSTGTPSPNPTATSKPNPTATSKPSATATPRPNPTATPVSTAGQVPYGQDDNAKGTFQAPGIGGGNFSWTEAVLSVAAGGSGGQSIVMSGENIDGTTSRQVGIALFKTTPFKVGDSIPLSLTNGNTLTMSLTKVNLSNPTQSQIVSFQAQSGNFVVKSVSANGAVAFEVKNASMKVISGGSGSYILQGSITAKL